jgi:hypothetical protein
MFVEDFRETALHGVHYHLRSSIRMDARLDATTREKVDDLAKRFHRPRAVVLGHIMQWGLSRGKPGPLNQSESQGLVRHLSLYVASELFA